MPEGRRRCPKAGYFDVCSVGNDSSLISLVSIKSLLPARVSHSLTSPRSRSVGAPTLPHRRTPSRLPPPVVPAEKEKDLVQRPALIPRRSLCAEAAADLESALVVSNGLESWTNASTRNIDDDSHFESRNFYLRLSVPLAGFRRPHSAHENQQENLMSAIVDGERCKGLERWL